MESSFLLPARFGHSVREAQFADSDGAMPPVDRSVVLVPSKTRESPVT